MVARLCPPAQGLHRLPGQGKALGRPFGKEDGDPGHQRMLGHEEELTVEVDPRRGEPANGVGRLAAQERETGFERLQRGQVFERLLPQDDLPQPPRGVVRLEGHPLAVIGDGQTSHGFEPAEKDSVPGMGDDEEAWSMASSRSSSS